MTKKFYERFSAEHEAFADFIAGLTGATDKAWYASLMFVYFIQRKGFLDGNINYLADRMQRVRSEAGDGHFHSFYRMFLRRLLGQAKGARGMTEYRPQPEECEPQTGCWSSPLARRKCGAPPAKPRWRAIGWCWNWPRKSHRKLVGKKLTAVNGSNGSLADK